MVSKAKSASNAIGAHWMPRFYAETFPDCAVGTIHYALADLLAQLQSFNARPMPL